MKGLYVVAVIALTALTGCTAFQAKEPVKVDSIKQLVDAVSDIGEMGCLYDSIKIIKTGIYVKCQTRKTDEYVSLPGGEL
jgi:hypothetical protein